MTAGLATQYDLLVSASRAGDVAAAAAAFYRIVGLRPRRTFEALPSEPVPAGVPMLRYGEPRRLDLIALTEGARAVAKFEDLSEERAAGLTAELRSRGLKTVQVGPYAKRFDVAVSEEARAAGLYTVIGSRGTEAEAVAEAERERSSEGTRAAGLALGYPPCCVDRFVAVEQASQAAGESINEAAIRSIEGIREPWPWPTNVLSSMSPIGFVPCRTTCGRAMAFARRVLGAAEKVDPAGSRVLKDVLQRPILFFRYSLFYVLDGAPLPGPEAIVRYRRALPNDDGTALDPWLRRWPAEELGTMLAEGDEVSLTPGTLSIRLGGARVAEWALDDPAVPLLLRFRPE